MWDGVRLHREEEEESRRGDGVIMEAVERKHSEGVQEDIETMVRAREYWTER